jgi:serine/threonine-protein phosphatase 6 regulatory ankyrin repeat subunit B
MFAALACVLTGSSANAQNNDLLTAAGRGDLPAVNALLNAGASVNDAKDTRLGSITALMEASSNGHLEVVQALLAAKANVNAKRGPAVQSDCDTALALASRSGHLNVVQTLLAAKADVDAGSVSALYCATASGNLDIVRALVAEKPDLDWQDPSLGTTTLMLALAPNEAVLRNQLPRTGRWDIAQLLVEAGASVNVMDKGGVTALKLVVQENGPRALVVVQALLAAHADVNGGCVCRTTALLPLGSARHMSAQGHTALGLAVSLGSAEVVQALLDANAQRAANPAIAVDAKQLGGNTPLTLASARGRSDVVRLLLAAKADVSAADDNGKTALMLAVENGHLEVADLLRRAGL